MFQVTSDGTIRMSMAELSALTLCHESSGLYSEPLPANECGRPTHLIGFTEWIAEDTLGRVVTLSWDWRIDPFTGECLMEGLPYSNIELMDERGGAIAWRSALMLLAGYVGSLRWVESVRSVIE